MSSASDAGGHWEDDRSRQFVAPPLEGRHVQLRPLTPRDYESMQRLEFSTDLAIRWRFRGSTPSPELWAQTAWRTVLAQYVVVTPRQQRAIGLVVAYSANYQDQSAYVAAVGFQSQRRSPVMLLGFGLFLNYVFACWQFRKLYLEVPEYNYGQFASGVGRYFQVEARLRDHFFFGGQYWDQLTLAIYRDAWTNLGERLVAVERSPSSRRVRVRMTPLTSEQ
jgi:RimJ/RimL family protein N-acetyltransferase